jgi:hypothetical protein
VADGTTKVSSKIIAGDDDRERRSAAARERVLEALGHRPEYHRPCQPLGDGFDWEAAPEGKERDRVLRRLAAAGTAPEKCGWWWCATPGQVRGERGWDDLLAAAKVLTAAGREFDSQEAAGIAWRYEMTRLWRDQADELEGLRAVIASFEATEGSDAAVLKSEFIERLRPLIERASYARAKGKRRGPPVDRTIGEALQTGEQLGWNSEEVAAMLLLVGVDRSSWDSLRDAVRKADARRKSRETLPP